MQSTPYLSPAEYCDCLYWNLYSPNLVAWIVWFNVVILTSLHTLSIPPWLCMMMSLYKFMWICVFCLYVYLTGLLNWLTFELPKSQWSNPEQCGWNWPVRYHTSETVCFTSIYSWVYNADLSGSSLYNEAITVGVELLQCFGSGSKYLPAGINHNFLTHRCLRIFQEKQQEHWTLSDVIVLALLCLDAVRGPLWAWNLNLLMVWFVLFWKIMTLPCINFANVLGVELSCLDYYNRNESQKLF